MPLTDSVRSRTIGLMRSTLTILVLAVVVSTAIAFLWWAEDPQKGADGAGPGGAAAKQQLSTEGVGIADGETSPAVKTNQGMEPYEADYRAKTARESGGIAWNPTSATASPAKGVWPVAESAAGGAAGGTEDGEPEVPVKVAFRALWYVGVDPQAEKIWMRAINDPRHPPGVRSDLIEDLHDEGYSDNSHPTKADLPIILARMELIERIAPYALDQVNADAFEEAYKDLLNKYIRLGGEPRK